MGVSFLWFFLLLDSSRWLLVVYLCLFLFFNLNAQFVLDHGSCVVDLVGTC